MGVFKIIMMINRQYIRTDIISGVLGQNTNQTNAAGVGVHGKSRALHRISKPPSD